VSFSGFAVGACAFVLFASAPALADDPPPQPLQSQAQPAQAPVARPPTKPPAGVPSIQLAPSNFKPDPRFVHPRAPVAGSAVPRPRPAPPVFAPATPLELDFARADPKVVLGVLPNGLRYAIYERPSHGRENIQLRMLAGSRDEGPHELGAAHFLEHMAFNGSNSFPAQTLMKRFEEAGIAFGKDQNAFTFYKNTVFILDLPETNKAKLDLSFRWLGDVADGLTIEQDEVDRERGVVLSEYRLQLGPAWDSARAIERFKLAGLRGAERTPIGTEATIKALNADELRAFYRRWYRPDRAILVAVGEAPAADVKARIEASFGGWKRIGPAPEHPADGALPAARPADALTLAQPALEPMVQICRFTAPDKPGPQSAATRRAEIADLMWLDVLDRRLRSLRRADKPAFVGAAAGKQLDYDAAVESCMVASPLEHDWKGALAVLAAEARRFEAYGPTPQEYAEAQADVMGALNHAVTLDPTDTPDKIAPRLLNALDEGSTFATPEEERRIQFRALAALNPSAVRDAFQRRWTKASEPLITVQAPEPAAKTEAMDGWRAAMAAPAPSAPVDETLAAWAYNAFGAPGHVVSREVVKDPDFVRLKFANGLVVNFKQSTLAKGEVLVRIYFGGGDLELSTDDDYAAKVGAVTLLEGGFGKNNAEDLTRVCIGRPCNATLTVERAHFHLDGQVTLPSQLGLELQLLSALLTDPGFRPSMDTHIPTLMRAAYRQWAISPTYTAALEMQNLTLPPRPLLQPPLSQAITYRHGDFDRILKPVLTHDAMEVTIVGDIDEPQLTDLLTTTLGALPSREPGEHFRPDAPRVRYPAQAPAPVTVFHDGPKDRAAVLVSWPLFQWTPERTHDGYVLYFLAQMYQDALLEEIREKLGKTYAPAASAQTYRGGDEGAFTVSVETSPEAAQLVADAVRRISLNFAHGRMTAEDLERARRPIADEAAKEKTFNAWWLETLDGSYIHPDRLQQTRIWDHDIGAITLDEVRAAARRWLSPKPMVVLAMPCRGTEPCNRDLQAVAAER
jgi:zinc protease